jgi:hypothetical protein
MDRLLEEHRVTVFENVLNFNADGQDYHRHDKSSKELLHVLASFFRGSLVPADVFLILGKNFLDGYKQLFTVV